MALNYGRGVTTTLQKSDEQSEGSIAVQERNEVKRPSFYKVLLHNDHYTPMDFVVDVLMRVFGKGAEEAHRIMMEVHVKGMGLCGVYSYEVAETKANMVMRLAEIGEYPLRCTVEKET